MATTSVDASLLDDLIAAARSHPRRRMNRNLHRMEDPIHRLLNAMEPDSYVQPHRHATPPRRETLSVVRGRGGIVVYDDAGAASEVFLLSPTGPTFVLELPAGAWHTLLALEPGTVWLEIKEGPYVPPAPSDVATWAPAPASGGAAVADWLAATRRIIETRSVAR